MKVKIMCIVLLVLFAPALAAIPHGTARADGDSFLEAVSGDNPRHNMTFVDRTARYYDLDLTNAYIGGTNTSAILAKIYSEIPNPPSGYDTHIFNAGFGDMRKWYNEPEVETATANRIATMVAYMRVDVARKATNSQHLYTGRWIRNVTSHDAYSLVVNTSLQAGDTMQTTVPGDTFTLGFTQYSGSAAAFTISVDGTVKYTYNPGISECPTIADYCASAIEISELGEYAHNVTVTNTNGNRFSVDWTGYRTDTPPFILVNGITKSPNYPTAYDTTVDATNAAIQKNIAEMFDEDVIYVDQDSFDAENLPLIGPGADITHPNNYGHDLMFRNILEAL